MAEGGAAYWKEHFAEIAECPICSGNITNNRLLPCGHTFCLECLERYRKTSKSKGKQLPCPVCRVEFTIPKDGCSVLPKNIMVEKLLELNYDSNRNDPEEEEVQYCDTCDRDSPAVAKLHCIECDQNLCPDCEKLHGKLKVSVGHHVIPASKSSQYREVFQRTHCDQHPEFNLELVCTECIIPICWKCRSLFHPSHAVDELGRLVDSCREQLQSNIEEIEGRISFLKKFSEQIKDQEKKCRESFEKQKSDVSKKSSELIRMVVSNEEVIQKKLNSTLQQNLNSLQPQKTQIESQTLEAKQLVASMEQLKQCDNQWEIYKRTQEYHKHANDLLSKAIVKAETPIQWNLTEHEIHQQLIGSNSTRAILANRWNSSSELFFSSLQSDSVLSPGNYEEDNHSSSSLAPELPPRQRSTDRRSSTSPSRRQHKESSSQDECNALSFSLISDWSLGNGCAVLGVSAFGQRLFVAVENSADILVYDSMTFDLQRRLPVSGLKQTSDMALSPSAGFLYVADWDSRAIFQVPVERTQQRAKKWSTGGDFGGISIIPGTGSLLFSAHETGSLKEFNNRGDVVKELKIRSSVNEEAIRPWHALKLSSIGEFLVSHGGSGPSALHRVCVVNATDGRVVQSFGDLRGRGPDRLFGPYHLAIDSKGTILVVDCNNSRIVALDRDLKFLKEFPNVFRKPRRITFDSTNSKFYATDNTLKNGKASDGKLLVFSLNYERNEVESNYN